MIKVNEIKETTCRLIDPDGNEVGIISSILELNDIRIQIKKNKVPNYHILWNDPVGPVGNIVIIYIDKSGYLDEWPKGFFDLIDNQLETLIDWV